MECPVCNETLQIADRQGVEIDYCPKCRGIWLDRGELDKLIERSVSLAEPNRNQRKSDSEYPASRNERIHDSDYKHTKPKKQESWLSRMFDFD